jgi:predicted ArsR family transcriptional regulator
MSEWTFFSNHAHVLFVLSSKEQITVRELASEVGITERFAHKVINDLQNDGYLSVEKEGRNNRYKVNPKKKLRHPVEGHIQIGPLIKFVSGN